MDVMILCNAEDQSSVVWSQGTLTLPHLCSSSLVFVQAFSHSLSPYVLVLILCCFPGLWAEDEILGWHHRKALTQLLNPNQSLSQFRIIGLLCNWLGHFLVIWRPWQLPPPAYLPSLPPKSPHLGSVSWKNNVWYNISSCVQLQES